MVNLGEPVAGSFTGAGTLSADGTELVVQLTETTCQGDPVFVNPLCICAQVWTLDGEGGFLATVPELPGFERTWDQIS